MVHPVTPDSPAAIDNPVFKAVKNSVAVLAGVALITASAKTTVPFWPVPMTLQTMAIMAIALATGPRMAVAIMLTYLAAGAVGLPVFAGTPERGIGIAYMMGPTGGYLAGYLVAAGLVGALARGRGAFGRFVVMMGGMVPVYLLGLAGLSAFVPSEKVLALGFTPFILGDTIKIALVALGFAAASRLKNRNVAG
ncbi:biotin transporter BioY [Thalassospira sp. GO-4]|jgi:biotin transport system substrate-specific component|uniref:biotin transporter BioY n=1 Tax=Thalassospira TaxID=168934 RepID=UPI002023D101|nr:biotin transporter BioY [Thalassospira sp. GO-4]URK16577.1 biotin transporter BioY [Thalassospira sp. GO-4]